MLLLLGVIGRRNRICFRSAAQPEWSGHFLKRDQGGRFRRAASPRRSDTCNLILISFSRSNDSASDDARWRIGTKSGRAGHLHPSWFELYDEVQVGQGS